MRGQSREPQYTLAIRRLQISRVQRVERFSRGAWRLGRPGGRCRDEGDQAGEKRGNDRRSWGRRNASGKSQSKHAGSLPPCNRRCSHRHRPFRPLPCLPPQKSGRPAGPVNCPEASTTFSRHHPQSRNGDGWNLAGRNTPRHTTCAGLRREPRKLAQPVQLSVCFFTCAQLRWRGREAGCLPPKRPWRGRKKSFASVCVIREAPFPIPCDEKDKRARRW